MSVQVNDPVSAYFPDEKSVSVRADHRENTLHIHPWSEGTSHFDSEVYVAVGLLKKNGDAKGGKYENIIVDREDFVEAILAVFPELARA